MKSLTLNDCKDHFLFLSKNGVSIKALRTILLFEDYITFRHRKSLDQNEALTFTQSCRKQESCQESNSQLGSHGYTGRFSSGFLLALVLEACELCCPQRLVLDGELLWLFILSQQIENMYTLMLASCQRKFHNM